MGEGRQVEGRDAGLSGLRGPRGTAPPPESWAAAVLVTGSETRAPGGGGATALAQVGGSPGSGWGSGVPGTPALPDRARLL